MRAAFALTAALVVSCAALACSAFAQDRRLEVGPWTADIGEARLESLRWQGGELIQLGGIGGYLPQWQGDRFSLEGAEVEMAEDQITWHRAEPGNQEATVTLRLSPERATFRLHTIVQAAGPTEFWVQIVPEAVCAGEQCFVWTDERELHTLSLDEPFGKLSELRRLRFEQPERSITIACTGFELQDRRQLGSGLFLVDVIGSSGDRSVEATRVLEIEVQPVPAEQIQARRQMLSQAATERSAVEVPNGGFEDGLEGWSDNPLASVDEEIVHSGERAARLTIEGQLDSGQRSRVYLTRMIPVQQRHLYRASAWIRGENVQPMTQGGMPPVGATVIMEFADTNGDWFAGGSYAASNYETFDWRHLSTEVVRAPEGAGYAIIYLALRGVGTAWFDDVTMEHVRHNVVLLSPPPGAELHDNTPSFDWQFNRETWADVEMSQDPAFPAETTRVMAHVSTPPITVQEPMEPGVWRWRVRVPDYDAVSQTWSFRQTASPDEDTTEPRVAERHDWLATPRSPMRIEYSDNVGVERVELAVDGRDVSAQVEMGDGEARYVPDRPWEPGLHVAQVRVEDAGGNAAQRQLYFTHSEPLPRIVWRRTGGVTIDGDPHFLLGMYGLNEDDMPGIAAAGFDYCHSYRWDGAGTTEGALQYLDAAHSHGLRVFMGLSRDRLMAHDERFVAERVAGLMRHPALLAWYLYDEPDLEHQYVSPMWLERYYRLIKSLDPFHPVVVTCARDDAVPRYRDALDVHWTQVYGNTAFVSSRIERHRASLREGTPLAAILHCYDSRLTGELRAGAEPDPADFQPDGRLMRANAFMAIAHNSSGLTWWWWGYGGGDRYFTVANAPRAWASLQQTVADIHALEPVLTAEGMVTMSVQAPAEGVEVHLWEKRLPDRVVAVAVNQAQEACDLRWRPQTPPATGTVQVLFEDRELALTDGELADTFGPLAVHVYEWAAP